VTRRFRSAAVAALIAAATTAVLVRAARAHDVSIEYRVKAAFLFNFTKFVEWPAERSAPEPLTICIAAFNPFGSVLEEIVHDESVNGRPLQVRVTRDAAQCDVLFIAERVAHEPYLRAVRGQPVLTVGERADFLRDGGIVNFVIEDGRVRFDIARQAASRAQLTISSRLLRLARAAISGMTPPQWQGP
jgi:YfiR/HmsC-like